MTVRSLLVVLVMFFGLAGCGVPLQPGPEAFQWPADETPRPVPPEGVLTTTIFLVDDTRLVPIERASIDTSPQTMLLLLAEGVTSAEAEGGLRSALVPGWLHPDTAERGPRVQGRVIQVAVTKEFARTPADDQLLATAQLVWTLTEGSAEWVRVMVGGEPLVLPTDTGLTDEPVGRADYRTVAPLGR